MRSFAFIRLPLPSCAACLLGASLLFAGTQAQAGEAVFLVGNGNAVDVVGVAYRTDTWKHWQFQNGGALTVFGEAELASWHGKEAQAAGTESNRNITAVGFKPVLRYYPSESASFRPYLDAGLGVHLLSATAINQSRRLPSAFEFGETLGVGVEFCPKHVCSVGLRMQHVSNGGLKQPNNGITFTQLSFGYRF